MKTIIMREASWVNINRHAEFFCFCPKFPKSLNSDIFCPYMGRDGYAFKSNSLQVIHLLDGSSLILQWNCTNPDVAIRISCYKFSDTIVTLSRNTLYCFTIGPITWCWQVHTNDLHVYPHSIHIF